MRINGNNGYEPNLLPTGLPDSPRTPRPVPASPAAPEGVRPELSTELQNYLEKAHGAEEVNRQAVEEAKALVRAGTLDTPEARRRAAESLLSLGM